MMSNLGDPCGGLFPAITPGRVPAQADIGATGVGLCSAMGIAVAVSLTSCMPNAPHRYVPVRHAASRD